MNPTEFVVELDGRRVFVDQSNRQVTILDDAGNVVFRDQIQVAAASKGLFSALESIQTGPMA